MIFKVILIYFCIINFVGFVINCVDKQKAIHNKWRIPEATLWLVGILGGAVGSYITMKVIRHKTKHLSFMIGMPILSVIDIATIIYLYISLGWN